MAQLVRLGNKPGLERITRLLELMDNPQNGYSCVHIAGTNGKGSTSVIISNVLVAAGYRVGRFTSPHLHSYRERITIDNQTIDAESMQQGLNHVEELVTTMLAEGYDRPTEFEVLTALAFWYFKVQKVKIAVMEVGMGGLYDSTNVIIPLVSIITSIDVDHINFLGPTLKDIALNKAGIIKNGVPVVAGPMDETCLAVIRQKAAALDAKLYISDTAAVSRSSAPAVSGQMLNINTDWLHLEKINFTLSGDYQLTNLSTALTALGIMQKNGYRIAPEHVQKALTSLKMPGRLEIVSRKPLVIIDVAHNPQGAKALNDSLKALLPGRQRVLVCGVLDDKDAVGILKNLGEKTRKIIITRPEGIRGRNWRRLKNIWQNIFPDKPCCSEENIGEAVKLGCRQLNEGEYLLVTGSFYVINQARRDLINT